MHIPLVRWGQGKYMWNWCIEGGRRERRRRIHDVSAVDRKIKLT